jgi:predicted Zn-dependent protease
MRRLLSLLTLAAFALIAADKDRKIPVLDDPNQIGNRDVAKGWNFYSLEKEIAMGKAMAAEVQRTVKLVNDPVISEYVNRLGQNLARNSDAQVPFIIRVIDDESVNAFALPGGFFFVNTGLILQAESEAELAGVMAHEIAHVAARHGTRQASSGQVLSWATLPAIFMGGGWAGVGVQQGIQLAVPMAYLKFSRGYEKEADNLGLQYMYKTGYDPAAFIDFFERIQALEKRKKGTINALFGSHPVTGSRIKDAQKRIERNLEPRPEYVVTSAEFSQVKSRLAMLQNRRQIDAPDPDGDPDGPVLRRRMAD